MERNEIHLYSVHVQNGFCTRARLYIHTEISIMAKHCAERCMERLLIKKMVSYF